MVYEIRLAIARQGWLVVSADTTPLPSNSVMAVVKAQDGRMVMGTSAGVVSWETNLETPWGDENTIIRYTEKNSGLGNNHVNSILQAQDGTWWFGTERGLAHLSGKNWIFYTGKDIGLGSDNIHRIVEDPSRGIWVATTAGAAVWDGKSWRAFHEDSAGLADANVQAIAVQKKNNGYIVWFGTLKGASRLELPEERWTSYDFAKYNLNWRGVSEILVDHAGTVWAGTLGGGLGKWDGNEWTFQRTDNSSIPANSIVRMIETSAGEIFVGFNYTMEPGGTLAKFDGKSWREYTPTNSGFTAVEPAAFAVDPERRLWIGTMVGGVVIFQLGK